MKRLTIFLLFSHLLLGAIAQSRHVMLLPEYEQGIVYMKSGLTVRVPLNYDAGMATMRYMDKEAVMELQNVQDIDSVRISSHLFVAFRGHFCEVFSTPVSNDRKLLVDWVMSRAHVGYKGAMGTISQVKGQNVNLSAMGADLYGDMNSIQGTTDAQTSGNSQDVYRTTYSNTYYIYKEGKVQKFKSKKQLLKLYSDHLEKTEQAMRRHHTDFQQPQTVIDAVLELLNSDL